MIKLKGDSNVILSYIITNTNYIFNLRHKVIKIWIRLLSKLELKDLIRYLFI